MKKIILLLLFNTSLITAQKENLLAGPLRNLASDISLILTDISINNGKKAINKLNFTSDDEDISELVNQINNAIENLNNNAREKIGDKDTLTQLNNSALKDIQKALKNSALKNEKSIQGLSNFISKQLGETPSTTKSGVPQKITLQDFISKYEKLYKSKAKNMDQARDHLINALKTAFDRLSEQINLAKADKDLLKSAEQKQISLTRNIESLITSTTDPVLKRNLQDNLKTWRKEINNEGDGGFFDTVKSIFTVLTDYFSASGRQKRNLSSNINKLINKIDEQIGSGDVGRVIARVPVQPLSGSGNSGNLGTLLSSVDQTDITSGQPTTSSSSTTQSSSSDNDGSDLTNYDIDLDTNDNPVDFVK